MLNNLTITPVKLIKPTTNLAKVRAELTQTTLALVSFMRGLVLPLHCNHPDGFLIFGGHDLYVYAPYPEPGTTCPATGSFF